MYRVAALKQIIFQAKIFPCNVYLWVILAIFLPSCNLVDANSPPTANDLQPLAVGNWWEYAIIRPQWQNPHQGTVREIVSYEIEAITNEGVFKAWAWRSDIDWGLLPEPNWLARNGDGGLYLMGGIADTDTFIINEIQYKYPAEPGDTWSVPRLSFSQTEYKFYISDTLEITLVDNKREVETPAGRFRCYVYYYRIPMGEDVLGYFGYYMFYSPGVGLIMQEEWGEHPSGNGEEGTLLSVILLNEYYLSK
jgi:hypothetical protein